MSENPTDKQMAFDASLKLLGEILYRFCQAETFTPEEAVRLRGLLTQRLGLLNAKYKFESNAVDRTRRRKFNLQTKLRVVDARSGEEIKVD